MQNETTNVAALIERLPNADKPGQESKFTGPEPDDAKEIVQALLKGGIENLRKLVRMVRDSSDPAYKNFKAAYLLHCVAVYLSASGNEELRREFSKLLASRIGRTKLSKTVRTYLVRELQVVGAAEVVEPLGKQLGDEDLCEPATQALLAIGEGAVAQLRQALPGSRGRNRMTIVRALGVAGDKESVPVLIETAGQRDRDVRMTAVWALAAVGDARAVDTVIKAGDAENVWERIQAAKACLVLAEKMVAGGWRDQAKKIYSYLRDSRNNPAEKYVQEAAAEALSAI